MLNQAQRELTHFDEATETISRYVATGTGRVRWSGLEDFASPQWHNARWL